MGNGRRLRKEAGSLLRVAKESFKFIRDNEVGHPEERKQILDDLLAVIDRADPPKDDDSLTTIKLTMTNASLDTLLEVLDARAKSFEEDKSVLTAVRDGARRTQQRAYVKLSLDHSVLRRLRYVLLHTRINAPQNKVFIRLAEHIESEALSKNPMEILGKMGL